VMEVTRTYVNGHTWPCFRIGINGTLNGMVLFCLLDESCGS
jgi:hypothetical protein